MQDPDVHMQVNVKIIEQSLDIVRSLTKYVKYYFHIFPYNLKTIRREIANRKYLFRQRILKKNFKVL